jgi:LPS-assembly protein
MPRLLALSLALTMLYAGPAARAAPVCPMPEEFDLGPEDDSGRLEVTADRADVTVDGDSEFTGGVTLKRGTQQLETEGARYDPKSGRVSALAGARYRQPGLEVEADTVEYVPANGRAVLTGGRYRLPRQPASGGADRIEVRDTGRIAMEEVSYTTCPGDEPDWVLGIDRLKLNTEREVGEAERVTLRFFGVPVIYWPYLSFPLSDRRKSGFLVPEFGQSERAGFEASAPYYFNLAPNYDYTLTPVLMSKRGLQLENRFRYLGEDSTGTVDLAYLYSDSALPGNPQRSHIDFRHITRFDNGWRFLAAIEDVSDTDYFQDLGSSPQITSQTHIERLLQADYVGDVWRIVARLQNFRTLDLGIPEADRPYASLPQVSAVGLWLDGPLGLDWRLRTEAAAFARDVGAEGGRAVFEPGVSLPLETRGFFLTPSASLRMVQYQLWDSTGTEERSPGYAAPVLSVDSGVLLDRGLSKGEFVQTLEPRMLYAWIPRRDQADLPLFDTGRPDFNYVQLFRPNRYLGADRIGDTNQLSLGVTTRLIEAASGREFLTASLGKAWYFADPVVTLPEESPREAGSSPIVLELGMGLFKHWNADIGYQWDNVSSDTHLAQFRVQYQPAPNRVANIAYRYRPELLEDVALSVGWPIAQRWSVASALEYSLRDSATVDRLIGIQYESCCWAVRLAATKQVSRRDGSTDTAVRLQVEFKGLAGLGGDARDRFEGDILGYSVYD